MGSPYPSKEAVLQAIVPPLALHAGASPHHERWPLEKGGKGNGRERDLGGGGNPGGV